MDKAVILEIVSKIRELETEYQKSKGMILTEEDLQCHVFRKIHSLFHNDLETMDSGILGAQLHSELKFFDEQDKLSIIPDITILDTARLSILHGVNAEVSTDGIRYEKYRTKQYEFGGDVIVIELKFCRGQNGITERDVNLYKSDLAKMRKLRTILAARSQGMNKLYALLVIFNKTDARSVEFDEFLNLDSEDIKIVYGTGKVQFNPDNDYLVKFLQS